MKTKKKKYIYFSATEQSKEFATLEAMREWAQDPAHNGNYYIGVPSSQRSYHRSREMMLKTFDESKLT